MQRTVLATALVLFLASSVLTARIRQEDDNEGRNGKEKRIINGKPSKRGEFPHHVVFMTHYGLPFCGGAIIDPHFILTAGHCQKLCTDGAYVVAGAYNYTNYKSTGQERTIDLFYAHEKYVYKSEEENYEEDDDKSSTEELYDEVATDSQEIFDFAGIAEEYNDIALVYVKEPFEFNDYVKTVALPSKNTYPTNNVTVSGWGYTEGYNIGSIPKILQKAELFVYRYEFCREKWCDDISPNGFCAGIPKKEIDICDGDSGSPAIQKRNGRTEIVGIVNFSTKKCADYTLPGVFLRVAPYLDWIEESKATIREIVKNRPTHRDAPIRRRPTNIGYSDFFNRMKVVQNMN